MRLANTLLNVSRDCFRFAAWAMSEASDPEDNNSLQESRGVSYSLQGSPLCIGQVRGQRHAKQALLIAAAGRHNVLLSGPPGEGKSLLASTMPGFMPQVSLDEAGELRRTYGASGTGLPIDASGRLLRPFRSISPAITLASLIAGGRKAPIPGELPLSHTGVLFIDELPQFPKALVEALRSPLESGSLSILRNGVTTDFPCKTQFIAAMNPCPCGWSGVLANPVETLPSGGSMTSTVIAEGSRHLCQCSPKQVQDYQSRISGPMLDRIDIIVRLSQVSNRELFSPAIENQSLRFLLKVCEAWRIAFNRQGKLNGELGPKEVLNTSPQSGFSPEIEGLSLTKRERYLGEYIGPLAFTPEGFNYFCIETDKSSYSSRRKIRLARVSRTVADLSACYGILPLHIQTARDYVAAGLNGAEV
jgi:magnesium chelatase family protein